ncbi:MAG TPA: FtsQ-type POTRA domain-containing protein [Nitrospiraceae bacterium]|nr:FtsQ-type POTRA domain-containing protein [Nitrospiraceae bacterium]
MAMASVLAKPSRKKRVEPRINARRASDSIEQEPLSLRRRVVRFGRRLMKVFYTVGLLGLFVAGCAGLFVLLRELGPLTKEWFAVRQVTVEGLDHVTRREVLARLALKPDATLYALNPNWMAERLRQHPWIKEATVSLVPFHEVRISIVERSPSAVVRTVSENLLTDEEGYILAHLGTKDDPSLPTLSGVDASGLLQGRPEARRAVKVGTELARLIASTVGGRADINVAHLSNLVASVQGMRFQFSAASMDQQWRRFLQMRSAFRDVAFDHEGERGQEFDLRYRDRVIIRGKGVS